MSKSVAERFAMLSSDEVREAFDGMSDDEITAVLSDWKWWQRPEQAAPPGKWRLWYIETGRGFGKTRTASEWIHEEVDAGRCRYGGLVHRTSADLRDIMIEGKSGLLATAKPGQMPNYEPSKRRITFHNGAQFTCFTSEEPDMLRGPELDRAWGEEFATWKSVTGIDGLTAFDNLRFAMRGQDPKLVLTTTPKRVKSVKTLHTDSALPGNPFGIVVTNGSLYDNIANLDADYVADIMRRHAGTALGEQEIMGKLAKTVEGAIFTELMFEASRVRMEQQLPMLVGHCVAVDPSVGDGTGDECGINVTAMSAGTMPTELAHGGLTIVRDLRHGYVLEDASIAGAPDVWAGKVVETAQKWGTRDIVVEGNQGGEMVRPILKALDPNLKVRIVHARVGKEARAQPVSALFAQKRWHIVGELPEMEDQCTTWVPDGKGKSPDRLDAMVWAAHHLEPGIGRNTKVVKIQPGSMSGRVG